MEIKNVTLFNASRSRCYSFDDINKYNEFWKNKDLNSFEIKPVNLRDLFSKQKKYYNDNDNGDDLKSYLCDQPYAIEIKRIVEDIWCYNHWFVIYESEKDRDNEYNKLNSN